MMAEAISISKSCLDWTYPNPKVGAVIFDNHGNILSQGHTGCYGSDHAETTALKALNFKADGLNMAVSLEPCNHFGKTIPCTHTIVKSGLSRVFIAKKEENVKSCGGAEYLKQNGVEVEFLDEFSKEVEEINKFFFKNIRDGRCWVTAKAAVSKDGFITKKQGVPTAVTSEKAKKHTHKLRASHMAIAVGAGTVNSDDPLLNVREVEGKDPVPVIYSHNLSLDIDSKIIKRNPVIFTSFTDDAKLSAFKSYSARLEVLEKNFSIKETLSTLWFKYNLNSLLLEGGSKLISAFFYENLIDEFHILVSPENFGKGLKLFNKEDEHLFKTTFSPIKKHSCNKDTVTVYTKNCV